MRAKCVNNWRKDIPARRVSKCKGPEAEEYLAHLQRPGGLEWMKSARGGSRR